MILTLQRRYARRDGLLGTLAFPAPFAHQKFVTLEDRVFLLKDATADVLQRVIGPVTGSTYLGGGVHRFEKGERRLYATREKIATMTAIPCGRYQVVLTHSTRFGMVTPELLLVPDFTAIRIHILNTGDETDGCPGVGMEEGAGGTIVRSKVAFDAVMRTLVAVMKLDKVWIDVGVER